MLGDDEQQLVFREAVVDEPLVVPLLTLGPELAFDPAEIEEFFGCSLEVEFVLLVLDHLGKVAVEVALLERTALAPGGDDGGGATDGGRFTDGEVSAEGALGIPVEQLQSTKDLIEERSGDGVRFRESAA